MDSSAAAPAASLLVAITAAVFLLCILMKLKGQWVTRRTTVKMWENAARSNVDYMLLWQWV